MKQYKDLEYERSVLMAEKLNREQRLGEMMERVNVLSQDTANSGNSYREIYNRYSDLIKTSTSNTTQLNQALQQNKTQLQKTEKTLQQRENELQQKERALAAREQLVKELQESIKRKEEAERSLMVNLQGALEGFSRDDLQIERKNGRVYVSMSDKLLFKPGDTQLDPQGKFALAKVANVVNTNPNIEVMIEGHTDNMPISNAIYKDNWDLSVYRATSIVRILTKEYGVSPRRVIAAGRGEHQAKADNEVLQGRTVNRRTEIILMPHLDEVYSIIQSNGR